jgi:hypothetical protein
MTGTLPASPATNLMVGIKDGGNNFSTNNFLVVAATGTTLIDGVTGTVGFTMNTSTQFNWFIFDGTQWDILG